MPGYRYENDEKKYIAVKDQPDSVPTDGSFSFSTGQSAITLMQHEVLDDGCFMIGIRLAHLHVFRLHEMNETIQRFVLNTQLLLPHLTFMLLRCPP
jgi:hypothetical protein